MPDKSSILLFLRDTFKTLELSDYQLILKASKLKRYEEGAILFRQGETPSAVYILISGLVRIYSIKSDGEEKTISFMERGDHVASPHTVLSGHECIFNAEVLESIHCLQFDGSVMTELEKKHPSLHQFKVLGMERALNKTLELLSFHLLYKPEERYRHFAESRPKLMNRVSQKHLASMLGMTPVSLSRIKKRLELED